MSTAAPTQNGNGNSHTIELPARDSPKKKVPHPPGHSKEGQPLTLPPGFTTQTFAEFITAARKIIEDQNVTLITDTAQLNKEQYMDPSKAHDMHKIFEKEYFVVSAVLYPRDVKDVQDVMRLCNEFEMPIWPFSIGGNTGYGGAAPRVPGSIALDLGRHMNKILEVNVEGAFALVERGVTFFDLHEYLVKNNLREKLWVNVPDGRWIDHWKCSGERNHWMMHYGMEVVLPSGELIRTGMGALPDKSRGHAEGLRPDQTPGNRAWQLFNYGFGPYNDGIFSQSNLDILIPNPGGYQAYLITLPKDDDLNKALEIIRPLRLQMVLQNVPTLRHILLDAAVSGNKKSCTDKDEPLNEDELDAIAKKMKLGRWNFYGAVYGPQPVCDVLWQTIKQAFSTIEGAQFILPEETRDHPVLQTRHGTLQGIPSTDEFTWVNWVPNGAHLFFPAIAQITGADGMLQYSMTKKSCKEAGIDFIGTFTIGMREMHHIVCIVFDRYDKEKRDRAHWLIRTLIQDAAEHGWDEYQMHLILKAS